MAKVTKWLKKTSSRILLVVLAIVALLVTILTIRNRALARKMAKKLRQVRESLVESVDDTTDAGRGSLENVSTSIDETIVLLDDIDDTHEANMADIDTREDELRAELVEKPVDELTDELAHAFGLSVRK
jgi:hypothetical protein